MGKNEYVSIIKYKNGTFDIILKRFKHFFNCLQDDYFVEKYLELNKYNEAVKKYGELDYYECFTRATRQWKSRKFKKGKNKRAYRINYTNGR